MGTFKWRSFAVVPFLLIFFTLFACNTTSTQLMSNALPGDLDACKLAFCGKGTCRSSATDLLGFKCDCDSGWKKPKIGSFEFPACLFPNCTVDLQCGNGSPAPQSPPPLPSLKFSNPCSLTLCGDGTCVSNGSEFKCQCNEGSANLLDDPKFTCFKKCSLGADCNGIDLGFGPSDGQTPPSSPAGNSGSPPSGFGERLNCSRGLCLLTTLILATIFLK